jgi:hypothetical protein
MPVEDTLPRLLFVAYAFLALFSSDPPHTTRIMRLPPALQLRYLCSWLDDGEGGVESIRPNQVM